MRAAGTERRRISDRTSSGSVRRDEFSRSVTIPPPLRLLADRIGTLERLKLLTLLTYADISAVNPAAMTPWRLEQLWETYRVTHQQLLKELETERIADLPKDLPAGLPDPEGFIRGFPSRYLRTHTSDDIRAHLRALRIQPATLASPCRST